jgi:hypothetical protein
MKNLACVIDLGAERMVFWRIGMTGSGIGMVSMILAMQSIALFAGQTAFNSPDEPLFMGYWHNGTGVFPSDCTPVTSWREGAWTWVKGTNGGDDKAEGDEVGPKKEPAGKGIMDPRMKDTKSENFTSLYLSVKTGQPQRDFKPSQAGIRPEITPLCLPFPSWKRPFRPVSAGGCPRPKSDFLSGFLP